jgi:hypothetical protein
MVLHRKLRALLRGVIKWEVTMGRTLSVGLLLLAAAAGSASAQGNLGGQCSGVSGKTLACCQRVVTANPAIAQCDKERAVFKCAGSKKYVSRNGCGTFTR